jgi:hypothetical protein
VSNITFHRSGLRTAFARWLCGSNIVNVVLKSIVLFVRRLTSEVCQIIVHSPAKAERQVRNEMALGQDLKHR